MMMSIDKSRNDDAVGAIDDSRIVFRILVKGDILPDLRNSVALYENINIGQRKAIERSDMEAVFQKQHDKRNISELNSTSKDIVVGQAFLPVR